MLGHERFGTHQADWVLVAGATNIASLSLGLAHICGLVRDGTIDCWGLNDDGQLGRLPTQPMPEVHTAPVSVIGVTDSVAVNAMAESTCALTTDCSVYCWGRVDLPHVTEPQTARRMPVPRVVKLAGNPAQTCVLTTEREVYCWGGAVREAGGRSLLTIPTAMEHLRGASDVSAGEMHICAALQGTDKVCWWSNGDDGPVSSDIDWLEK